MKITINSAIFIIFLLSFCVTMLLYLTNRAKKRTLHRKPFVSFIVPAHNDESSVEKTIRSIYSSYDKNKFEIFVVNDGSKDKTLEVLKNLSKKLKINIVSNKTNIGKSNSVNSVFRKTRGGGDFCD